MFADLEALFGVPVIDTYGMTEAATQIAANSWAGENLDPSARSAGAEHCRFSTMKVDGFREANAGRSYLRGRTITRGYDNDAAATRASFQNGWFRTGDLGYLDAEGYLFVVGRIKEVINRGGQKVAPGEVEEALLNFPTLLKPPLSLFPTHDWARTSPLPSYCVRGSRLTIQKLRLRARTPGGF